MAFDPKKKKPAVSIAIGIGKKPDAGPGGGGPPSGKPGMPDLPPFMQKKKAGADPAAGAAADDPEPDPSDPNEAAESESEGAGDQPDPTAPGGSGGGTGGGGLISPERSGFRKSSAGEVCGNCVNYDHASQACSKVAMDQIDPNDTCGVFFEDANGGQDEGEGDTAGGDMMGGGGAGGGMPPPAPPMGGPGGGYR